MSSAYAAATQASETAAEDACDPRWRREPHDCDATAAARVRNGEKRVAHAMHLDDAQGLRLPVGMQWLGSGLAVHAKPRLLDRHLDRCYSHSIMLD